MRRFEIHKSGEDEFAAHLIGFGFAKGNGLIVEGGTARGSRLTFGIWFAILTIWVTGPHYNNDNGE